PLEFADVLESQRRDDLRAFVAGDYDRGFGQRLERRNVEMIHVRVRDQYQVELLQLSRAQRRIDDSLGADGQNRVDRHADAREQTRVGEHARTEEIHQHGRVAEIGYR